MQCEMRTYVLAGSELLLPREASAIVDAQICSLPTANAESWIPATSAGMTWIDYSAARISSSSVSPGRTIVKATGSSVTSTWPSRREATV